MFHKSHHIIPKLDLSIVPTLTRKIIDSHNFWSLQSIWPHGCLDKYIIPPIETGFDLDAHIPIKSKISKVGKPKFLAKK